MTTKTNKPISNILTKLLLFLLIASFILWGVSDVFRGSSGTGYAAKIADETITIAQYRQDLNLRMNNVREILGSDFSPELVKQLGLQQLVLQEMINRKLISLEAEALNIIIPESEILAVIRNNTAFNDGSGFNRDIFMHALRDARISEEQYVESIKQEKIAKLLLGSFDGKSLVAQSTAETIYTAKNETRDATLYVMQVDNIGKIAKPDAKQLHSYYAENGYKYKLPEYRKIAFFQFQRDKLEQSLKVQKDKILELYEERKLAYMKPEQRNLSQLLYSSKEDAIHALELINKGKTMEEVAEIIPPDNKEINLGMLTRATITASARDAVFSLAEGEFSNPIESSFGWHIFRVNKIEKEQIPDFAEIEKQLTSEWLESALEEKIYNLSIELEDMMAGGMTIEEIAAEIDQAPQYTEMIDKSGFGKAGSKVSLPPVKNLLKIVFSTEFEDMPRFVSGEDGNYYFLSLAEVEESKIPNLENVITQVQNDWIQEQQDSKLRELANKLASQLQSGNVDVLTQYKLEVKKETNIPRSAENGSTANGIISNMLRQELFSLDVNKFTGAYKTADNNYVIARLDAIHKPNHIPNDKITAEANMIIGEYIQEIEQQYLQYLRKKYPVEINNAIFNDKL